MFTIIFLILGILLLLASFGLIWQALKPTSTGNGAGAMAGIILIAIAVPTAMLGSVSLLTSLVIFIVSRL